MTNDDLRALADALEPMAKAPRFEDFDVPAFCAWLRAQADAEPVAWISAASAGRLLGGDGSLGTVPVHCNQSHVYTIPLYTHPAPAAPQAERQPVREPCFCDTAYPDSDPNATCGDCPRDYLPAASELTEAQIEARDALLDFISENGTASEGVQHYLDRYVRAALAAKEQK